MSIDDSLGVIQIYRWPEAMECYRQHLEPIPQQRLQGNAPEPDVTSLPFHLLLAQRNAQMKQGMFRILHDRFFSELDVSLTKAGDCIKWWQRWDAEAFMQKLHLSTVMRWQGRHVENLNRLVPLLVQPICLVKDLYQLMDHAKLFPWTLGTTYLIFNILSRCIFLTFWAHRLTNLTKHIKMQIKSVS